MEALIREVVLYVIILSVLCSILSNTEFEKYIKYVGGIILITIISGKIITLLNNDGNVMDYINKYSWDIENEDLDITKDDMLRREKELYKDKIESVFKEYSMEVKDYSIYYDSFNRGILINVNNVMPEDAKNISFDSDGTINDTNIDKTDEIKKQLSEELGINEDMICILFNR